MNGKLSYPPMGMSRPPADCCEPNRDDGCANAPGLLPRTRQLRDGLFELTARLGKVGVRVGHNPPKDCKDDCHQEPADLAALVSQCESLLAAALSAAAGVDRSIGE